MTKIHVAIAILYQDGKFLCQLRGRYSSDQVSGMLGFVWRTLGTGRNCGSWSIAGISEEIAWAPASVSFVCCDVEGDVVRHVFHSQLSADVNDLVLQEGWDMKLLTVEDIRVGKCYSRSQEMCDLSALLISVFY